MPPGMAEVTAAAALRLMSQPRLRQMQSLCCCCRTGSALTISGCRRGLWFSVTVELARAVYLKPLRAS